MDDYDFYHILNEINDYKIHILTEESLTPVTIQRIDVEELTDLQMHMVILLWKDVIKRNLISFADNMDYWMEVLDRKVIEFITP